jgi:hypothetical protein
MKTMLLRRSLITLFSAGWLLPLWVSVNILFEYYRVDLAPRLLLGQHPVHSFPFIQFSQALFTGACVWLAATVLFWGWRVTKATEECREVKTQLKGGAMKATSPLMLAAVLLATVALPPALRAETPAPDSPAPDWLRHDNLATLSVEEAKGIMAREGRVLSLDGLQELSPDVAKVLAGFKGEELDLMGLKTLSAEAAKALAGGNCDLGLNGLASISDEAAGELGQFKGGRLFLKGLTKLSPAAAKSLAGYKGKLFLSIPLPATAEDTGASDDSITVRLLEFKPDKPFVGELQSKVMAMEDPAAVEKLLGKDSASELLKLVDFAKEKIVLVNWSTSGPPEGSLKHEVTGAGRERRLVFYVQGPAGATIRGMRAMLAADFFAVPRDIPVTFDAVERF